MDILIKARSSLIISQPFFGTLVLGMAMTERADIDTMATDGTSIFYNPSFVAKLPFDHLCGVLAHEVMHVACFHHTRRNGRDLDDWNKAADYAINQILVDAKIALPKWALLDAQYSGMSAEQIYALIHTASQSNGGNQPGAGTPSGDPGMTGGVIDAPSPAGATQAAMNAAENETRVKVIQAANAAKAAGLLGGGLARVADAAKVNRVDWREELNRFAKTLAKDDYQWNPPNRRFVSQGLYLPAIRSEQVGPLVVVVDTSGSINDAVLAAFGAEIKGIVSELRPISLHVIYCDSNINRVDDIDMQDIDTFKLDSLGGGGTDFRPPFAYIERENIEPVGLIYLTDLYGSFLKNEPEYPVLWVSISKLTAPYGDTINIEL